MVKYVCRGPDPDNPCGVKHPGPGCQKRGRFSRPCSKLTIVPDRQTDLVKDFNFPKVPTTLKIKRQAFRPVYPCTDCGQKKYCREREDFLNCDEYLQWRKERGFSPVTKVGK